VPDEDIFFGGGGGGGRGPPAEEAAPVAEAVVEPPKVKDVFELKLKVVDAKAKIKIIKEVRTITGLGLKEAKDLVEKAPCIVKDNLSKADADKFLKVLVEAGAEAELV
jgi:large subunit ribosomal protein L7/L12